MPRHLNEGEQPQRLGQLPFGDPSSVQMTYRFMARPLNSPLAVMAPAVEGDVRLFVNGVPVKGGEVLSAPGLSRPSARGLIWTIPPTFLHAGATRVDILTVNVPLRALGAPIYVGPAPQLESIANRNAEIVRTLRQIAIVAASMAMLANMVALAVRAPSHHLSVAALFAAAGTSVLLTGLHVDEALGPMWPVADQLVLAAFALCGAITLREIRASTADMDRRLEAGLLVAVGLLGVAGVIAAMRCDTIAGLLGATAILISLIYLAMHLVLTGFWAARLPGREQIFGGFLGGLWGAAIVAMVAGLIGVAPAGSPFAGEIALPLVISFTGAVATWRGASAVVRQVQAHISLKFDQTRIIRQQQVALDATETVLALKARQSAILEERQRMARDVHDGIGGQLASLIAQVRMRRVTMEHVEEALLGGLSELRLMVDSLDVVGETLADALASFLVRARQQTAAAGILLDWSQTDDLTGGIRDPQWILNLYRLMQEAITNALRHSGGDRISVSINSDDGKVLSVRIEDNGTDFDLGATRAGRGLTNMAHRAEAMGGILTIGRSQRCGGALVCLEVPVPR